MQNIVLTLLTLYSESEEHFQNNETKTVGFRSVKMTVVFTFAVNKHISGQSLDFERRPTSSNKANEGYVTTSGIIPVWDNRTYTN